jgi:hypothetical protein
VCRVWGTILYGDGVVVTMMSLLDIYFFVDLHLNVLWTTWSTSNDGIQWFIRTYSIQFYSSPFKIECEFY